MPTLFREVNTFSLSGGAEVAVFGWWWLTPFDATLAGLAGDIGAVDDDYNWWESTGTVDVRAHYSGQTAWARRTLELYDIDTGHIVETRDIARTDNLTGASAAGQLPAEVAMVVSVRSGFSDRAGNGRFYLPPPAVDNLTGPGAFLLTFMTDVALAFQGYFDAVVGEGLNCHAGTYSKTDHAFTPARSINVGSIPDAQRRRRNKLVEARVVEALL